MHAVCAVYRGACEQSNMYVLCELIFVMGGGGGGGDKTIFSDVKICMSLRGQRFNVQSSMFKVQYILSHP